MNSEYHKRLLGKLEKGLLRCKGLTSKTTITLGKHELEDLYMLWKHKVPQSIFKKIFEKEMKNFNNSTKEECTCGARLWCPKCKKHHICLVWCRNVNNSLKCDAKGEKDE